MRRSTLSIIAAVALSVAACTSASTSPSVSTEPASAPPSAEAPASAPASAEASASAPASVAPSAVAAVPADQLIFPGKLVVCSDIPYPPQEYFDANGNPIGSDIEIATEIATRLGLERPDRELGLRHDHRGRDRRQVRHHHLGPEHHR